MAEGVCPHGCQYPEKATFKTYCSLSLLKSVHLLWEDPPSKYRGSPVSFTQSSPVVTACKAIGWYPSQDVDTEIIHTSYPHFFAFTGAHMCMHVCACVFTFITLLALCTHHHIKGTNKLPHHRKNYSCCPFPHPSVPLPPPNP